MSLSVKDKIVLLRHGASTRSEKVREAELQGCAGVLLFSDPLHYTTTANSVCRSIFLPFQFVFSRHFPTTFICHLSTLNEAVFCWLKATLKALFSPVYHMFREVRLKELLGRKVCSNFMMKFILIFRSSAKNPSSANKQWRCIANHVKTEWGGFAG